VQTVFKGPARHWNHEDISVVGVRGCSRKPPVCDRRTVKLLEAGRIEAPREPRVAPFAGHFEGCTNTLREIAIDDDVSRLGLDHDDSDVFGCRLCRRPPETLDGGTEVPEPMWGRGAELSHTTFADCGVLNRTLRNARPWGAQPFPYSWPV
jgi:hypothetical protein